MLASRSGEVATRLYLPRWALRYVTPPLPVNQTRL